jgi:arylsulfatase A-like enzyme
VSHPDVFPGVIGPTYRESTPWLPHEAVAPEGAPNILLVVLDDVGFAHLGCYGSDIETPNIDALAAGGLRYTNFHTTAMCSPTRASLLTGRNHHAVGMGTIVDWCTGYPGYQGEVSQRAAMLPAMLGRHGYNSFASGKWHLMRMRDSTAAGPFHNWPLGRGFDRFYGFMGATTDQFDPEIVVDNRAVSNPQPPGYHLSEDLVDQMIGFVRDQQSAAPGKPFFGYLAFGACHAPIQAPQANVDKYRGRFDDGWDVARTRWFQRQVDLGIVPPGTELTERCPEVAAWDELSPTEQRICARQQEVFAGYLDHADTQVGRMVAHLSDRGLLENTLIILLSDNGASDEGGRVGQLDCRKQWLFIDEPLELLEEKLDDFGTERSYGMYPSGWGHAGNTPLRWFKADTHGGGIRDPLIIHWPRGVAARGELRHQYHHCTDVVPTILELLDAESPATHQGVEQLPIDGTSMLYTFDEAGAPTRKKHQYYEMLGDRGIWADGWKAVAKHESGTSFETDRWELYQVEQDFSESHDLARSHPERLAQLQALWWQQAERNQVLPLDDREGLLGLRSFFPPLRLQYVYQPNMARIDRACSPPIGDQSYRMRADIEVVDHLTEGVILAAGNRFGGYALFVQHGRLVHEYVAPFDRVVLESPDPLPPGRRHVEYRFTRTGTQAGTGLLLVDGETVARVEMSGTWPLTPNGWGGLHCGHDACTPVSDRYRLPFAYTAAIHQVVIEPGWDYVADSEWERRLRLSED